MTTTTTTTTTLRALMAAAGLALATITCAGAPGGGVVPPGGGGTTGGGGSPGGGGVPAGGGGNTGPDRDGGGGETGGTTPAGGGTGGVPMQVPPRAPAGSCGLDKPAFCEDFEMPSPGGFGGDLDERVWSFARWGHETRQFFVRIPSSTETNRVISSTFCGKSFAGLMPPNDAVLCDGMGVDGLTSRQLNEVYDDQGDFALNSLRARQLFDFTDRTGTVVFDVDAKVNPHNLGHGWWVEFWITDDTAPMPYHEAPSVVSYPRNGFGINFQGLNDCPQGRSATTISRVFVTKNYAILHDYPGWELPHDSDAGRCFKIEDQKLNRIKVLISRDRAEIWASDAGDLKSLHRIAVAPILDLPFSRGYVHLQHSAYNAPKDGNVTAVQTYRWDNIGFDGPAYAVPRAYQVANNTVPDIDGRGGAMYGYVVDGQKWTTVQVKGVDLTGATGATFNFNTVFFQARPFQYRFNGGPTHAFTVPALGRNGLKGFSLDIPVAELVSGDNTIEVKMSSPEQAGQPEYVANLELNVTAGP